MPPERDFDVLEIVPHLDDGRVAQERSYDFAYVAKGQLLRRADVAVTDGNVATFPRVDGQRDSEQRSAHRLGRGRLDGRPRCADARLARSASPRRSSSVVMVRHCAGSLVLRRRGHGVDGDAGDHPLETELGVEIAQLFEIGAAVAQLVELERDGLVVAQRDELLRKTRVGLVFHEHLAQPFFRDFSEVRVDAVDGAVFEQKLARGLGAHRFDAGNVVGRVAHEREQIAHQRRRNAEFLLDFRRAVRLVAHRVPHRDAIGDELHQVFVRSQNHDEKAGLEGQADRRGNEIVGFDAVTLEDRDAISLDDLARSLHLRARGRAGAPSASPCNRRRARGERSAPWNPSPPRGAPVCARPPTSEASQRCRKSRGSAHLSCSRGARWRGTRETRSSRDRSGRGRRRIRAAEARWTSAPGVSALSAPVKGDGALALKSRPRRPEAANHLVARARQEPVAQRNLGQVRTTNYNSVTIPQSAGVSSTIRASPALYFVLRRLAAPQFLRASSVAPRLPLLAPP